MNLDTYLMIKTAMDSIDRDLYNHDLSMLSKADRRAYAKYEPETLGNVFVGKNNLPGKVEQLYGWDPKSRRISFGTNGFKDIVSSKGKHYTQVGVGDVAVRPLSNLRIGDPINSAKEYLSTMLHRKGYGTHELGNITNPYMVGLKGDDAIKYLGKKVGKNLKPTTVYFDDAGNIVNRSKGIVSGRRIGRFAGAGGGAIAGGTLAHIAANQLGLTASPDNSNGVNALNGFANGAITTAGGLGGMYFGGKYGNLAGQAIGGWIDPQKGTAIKMYTPKITDNKLLLKYLRK